MRLLWSDHGVFSQARYSGERDLQTGDRAVWCPELAGCVSAGKTEEEALQNIREAIALYLRREPVEVPPGSAAEG